MELVKHTPEEIAKIEEDHRLPHVSIVVFAPLDPTKVFQDHVSKMEEAAMLAIKQRADAAKMQVLSTSLSTNTLEVDGIPYLLVNVLCQWAETEKLEEMQRRAILAAGGNPSGRRA